MVFANGRAPAGFMVPAANGVFGQVLEPQTAAQWRAMVASAAQSGVTLRPQADDGIPSCYRSYDAQVYAKNQQLYHGGATAAVPGTSNHGLGTAVDIVITTQTLGWLRANAGRFGFDNNQGAADGENWHWVRTRTVANIEVEIDDVLDADDKKFMIQLGADIVSQTTGPIRADVNYIHTESPYSLKAIREAQAGGALQLTPDQVAALGQQLATSAATTLAGALAADQAATIAAIKALPADVLAAFKAAL